MAEAATLRLDVRDMLCAQALAAVDRACAPLAVGTSLEIVCNAADVRDDLLVWAREMGHPVMKTADDAGETHLWMTKGR